MITGLIGAVGFVCCLAYDVNSVVWKKQAARGLFAIGSGCIAAAALLGMLTGWQAGGLRTPASWLALAGAVLFGWLLVYTLFFALPFEETYRQAEQQGRKVYDRGMYALCRHPGVLWFFLMFLCLGAAFYPGALLWQGLVFSGCNLVYVLVQDRWTFPQVFVDYGDYRRRVPFLVPTRESVCRAWATRPAGQRGGAAE